MIENMEDTAKIARIFKVLSVNTRVRILQLLKKQSLCVNALAIKLGVTPAAVSQHLRILRDVELVDAEKEGYFVHYRINSKTLGSWKKMADTILQEKV